MVRIARGAGEVVHQCVDKVKGFVEGLPGNAGVLFLVDRGGSAALTVTLWHTQDAAEATDRFAEHSRVTTVAATGTELVATGRFEVVGTATLR